MATIKILYQKPDGSHQTMMFGDSYKGWEEQKEEFERYKEYGQWIEVERWKSKSKWKGWGGLKWCREEDFQEELNREGCQMSDPDNPNPRKYSEFVFERF